MGISPDTGIQRKNNKAMAQLAPLDHNPLTTYSSHTTTSQESGGVVNIPSIEYLQNQNKLQPLNHVPGGSKGALMKPTARKY